VSGREGSRNQKITPEEITPRERLKRRAVSVLSDFMVYDVTDDELDEIEIGISVAARQFLVEATRTGEFIFFDVLLENYFRRCLRAVDDWLFTEAKEIRPEFMKNIERVIKEMKEERILW